MLSVKKRNPVFYSKYAFDGSKFKLMEEAEERPAEKRVRRRTVAGGLELKNGEKENNVSKSDRLVTRTPGRRVRSRTTSLAETNGQEESCDEVDGLSRSPVIPLQGSISKGTPKDDLSKEMLTL